MKHMKWVCAAALMALMLAKPQATSVGAARAMAHWYASVAPALFPFLALMPLLTGREAGQAYERLLGRVTGALFNLPGAAASAMVVGMASGAPAGAIAARSVAAGSGMNRGQLCRLAVAFSGFSPAFLVGGIGEGLLGSAALGWKLLEAQAATQLTLALLLRRAWEKRREPVPEAEGEPGSRPMREAVQTILGICGYMMLFGAMTSAAGAYLGRGPADVALCLLDVPSGTRLVAELPLADEIKLTALSAMCGFGGICVIVQSLSALKGCGIRTGEFIALRALAGVISAGYMVLLVNMPKADMAGLAALVRGKPLEMAALIAVLLSVPVLKALKKTENKFD